MSKICVIGGANIDICGACYEPLKMHDSNPGEIEIRYGGVGRNIAEVCALLGADVSLVTAFSDDVFGAGLKRDCEMLGMDCSGSVTCSLPSSMYLAILDEKRDMHVAMSDMRILDHLKTETAEQAARKCGKDDILVLDGNLSEDMLFHLAAHAACMSAADPVSMAKARKFLPVMKHLKIFKPNRYEAEELTGILPKDAASGKKALNCFLEMGVSEVIISLAEEGVLLGTHQKKLWIRHRAVNVANATGGGDALMGAYLTARSRKMTPEQAAVYGITAAVRTIEMSPQERRKLNDEEIRSRIADMNIEETELV
ncbi:MAG: kinase [Erysipelotrichaceae bacterium]|nr:kinase [Erysipelotrichaceae bacterium]